MITGYDNGCFGVGGTQFQPDAPVTLEQMVTIIANYKDKAGAEAADQGVLSAFSDQASVSDWARGSVAWAKNHDLVSGYDRGGYRELCPGESIMRERAASILMNAFETGVLS